jgi:hypothetical protein
MPFGGQQLWISIHCVDKSEKPGGLQVRQVTPPRSRAALPLTIIICWRKSARSTSGRQKQLRVIEKRGEAVFVNG